MRRRFGHDRLVTKSIVGRIDRYLDAAPRTGCSSIEAIGPFTLFIGNPAGWPYYARPSQPAANSISSNEVLGVLQRQQRLDLPRAIEAVVEQAPGLKTSCVAAGMLTHEYPLMVHDRPTIQHHPAGVRFRTLTAGDDAVAESVVVAHLAFGGTESSGGDLNARDEMLSGRASDADDFLRSRIANSQSVVIVAEDVSGVVATGTHNPVEECTEIVGVATLPGARRKGIGMALSQSLVADAQDRRIEIVLLSAASPPTMHMYERAGFRRVATALAAELAKKPTD